MPRAFAIVADGSGEPARHRDLANEHGTPEIEICYGACHGNDQWHLRTVVVVVLYSHSELGLTGASTSWGCKEFLGSWALALKRLLMVLFRPAGPVDSLILDPVGVLVFVKITASRPSDLKTDPEVTVWSN
jgi:hypothetical protein